MKKFKARKEREQQEAIVRPRIEIEDPSDELFSGFRPWEHIDPLQDSFLEQPEESIPMKDHRRIPRLKFRCCKESSLAPTSDDDSVEDSNTSNLESNLSSSAPSGQPTMADLFSNRMTVEPEEIQQSSTEAPLEQTPPMIPPRHPAHTNSLRYRSRSLPPSRDAYGLTISPPKTDFQLFSQRCAPSPDTNSPRATTPVFELSAEEATYSIASAIQADSPVELEGSPVEPHTLYPAPLHVQSKLPSETEPEASPYNRFAAFTKTLHSLNANLAPIAETEEEAASRRSSFAQVYEMPATSTSNSILPSSYMGGTSIAPRNLRQHTSDVLSASAPCRNPSTRSSNSTVSTNSFHSMFSFEFTNSDSEKIYISSPTARRESAAPSLTDVSSVDDLDLEIELDPDARRSRSISRRDAKLERFFGIRQYSVSTDSDPGLVSDTSESPSSSSDSFSDRRHSAATSFHPAHRQTRSSISIDDLDLSLALENDPYKRELISMHRSLLSKTQNKQDAKLEKFFGCDKDQIQIARRSSTVSRLAGCADDLKYRSMGW